MHIHSARLIVVTTARRVRLVDSAVRPLPAARWPLGNQSAAALDTLAPQQQRYLHVTASQFKTDPIQSGSSPDRAWIDNFKRSDIPEQSYQVSFARASGPGGQNVNKVNTKVLLRFALDPPPAWLPDYCAQALVRAQATKINKHGELLVVSDKFRTQRQNLDDCIDKLYGMIVDAGFIPRETSAEQRKKVAGLAKADKERRLEGKKMAGKKKADRKVSRDF